MIVEQARGHEEKIVEYVNQKVEDLRQARQIREGIWLECMDAYMSKFRHGWVARARDEHRSARYLPLVWDAVENITAQLGAMIFPNEEWFQCKPGRRGGFLQSDDMDAPLVEQLLRTQHESMQFRAEYMKMLKWLVVTGNCPWSMMWHAEKAVNYPSYTQAMQEYVQVQQEATMEYEAVMGQYMAEAQTFINNGLEPPPPPNVPPPPEPPLATMDLIYDGPKLVVGDPFNFVIDESANDPVTAFRANTTWRTKAYLRNMAEVDATGYHVYENLDEIQDSEAFKADERSRNQAMAYQFGMQLPTKGSVKMVESVGDFELPLDLPSGEAGLLRSYICVVGNQRTLMRFEPNHLWSRESHMQNAILIQVPGQTYGLGLVENSLGLNDSIQVRHNQILDAGAVAINPETKVIDDGVFDPEHSETGPGAMHLVGTMDNLQPLEKNLSGLGLAFTEISMLKGLMEQMFRSTNINASFQNSKSATEVARDTSVMGASLQEMARSVEANSLLPILRMQLQYNQQYMNEEVVVRIIQDQVSKWETMSPQIVQRRWDIQVVGSANQMLKEKRLQDLMMFLQLVSGNPYTLQMVNLPYLLQVVYQEMGFTDGDKVFMPMPGFPSGMPPQQPPGGPASGQANQPQSGGSGDSVDERFPGIALPDEAPPGVTDIGPFTQSAKHGIMGA